MKLSDEAMDTGMGDLARSEITEVRVILGRRLREGGRGGERERGRERGEGGGEGREGEREGGGVEGGRERGREGREGGKEGFYFHSILYAVLIL